MSRSRLPTGERRTALIGYTGFVGGTLLRATSFDDLYNSSNIEELRGRRYDTLVCAGAPAEKWKANRDPAADRRSIARLMDSIGAAQVAHVVLISTVDVYPHPVGVDEATALSPDDSAPYGKHRLELERFLTERFDTTVVRLPALFGPGLKKNVVFDLLHENQVERVHAEAVFQFYPLRYLWRDVQVALANDLALVNFATEPTSVADVARVAFGRHFDNRPTPDAPRYDVRSRHAEVFGGRNGYLYDRDAVLSELAAFVAEFRSKSSLQ